MEAVDLLDDLEFTEHRVLVGPQKRKGPKLRFVTEDVGDLDNRRSPVEVVS